MKSFANGFTVACIAAVLQVLTLGQCDAQYARFTRPTDTISVAGNSVLSNSATYEARIMFTAFPSPPNDCTIYYEWRDYYEDKSLTFNQSQIQGFGYPLHNPNWLTGQVDLVADTWYHIAYVYDGSEERLYLDGNEIASRATSGNIANSSGSIAAVGCLGHGHNGSLGNSFIGCIDTLRISTVARYSGTSFQAPTGDLASDQYTNLLYNFDEPAGSSVVRDLSGNGRDGTLGVGFVEATSPSLVPEPSSSLALLCGLGGLAFRRRHQSLKQGPGRAEGEER